MSNGCGKCGFGKSKKKSPKSYRKSHKKSRKSPKVSAFGKKHFARLKKVSKRKRSGFGKISNLSSFMGNNSGNAMSTFQQYTGLPPGQMESHLSKVPMNLRSNFYTSF
jgi:hypothetical protein